MSPYDLSTSIDWKTAANMAVEIIQQLVRIDTTNPPGNELLAVQYIQSVLEKDGFPKENMYLLESQPGRANLIARLPGDGSKQPFLISGHVDVAPVEREHWTHDPFGGEIADGCIWGRGTMDMKGFLGMYIETFLEVFRSKLPLKRDLILAAVADEENGFVHGSHFLAQEHPDLIRAEYGITEGGAFTIHFGARRTYSIQVAEKAISWLRMTAEGEPCPGTITHPDNAVLHLTEAIEHLRRARHLPIHLTPAVLHTVDALADQLGLPGRLIAPLLHFPFFVGILLSVAPEKARRLIGPLFFNTVAISVPGVGDKTDVIPSAAEVQLECRLLPGQTPEQLVQEIRAVVGPEIKLELLNTTHGADSPIDNEMYRTLFQATRAMDPEGLIFPLVMRGATDASEYQQAGVKMYGFTPGRLPKDFPVASMAHDRDERIPLSYIESGLPVLWQVIKAMCI